MQASLSIPRGTERAGMFEYNWCGKEMYVLLSFSVSWRTTYCILWGGRGLLIDALPPLCPSSLSLCVVAERLSIKRIRLSVFAQSSHLSLLLSVFTFPCWSISRTVTGCGFTVVQLDIEKSKFLPSPHHLYINLFLVFRWGISQDICLVFMLGHTLVLHFILCWKRTLCTDVHLNIYT